MDAKRCRVEFEPSGIRAECAAGDLLAEVARCAGVGLAGSCGGVGVCGQCRVRIAAGVVSPPGDTECERLGAGQLAQGYRLACLARVLGDLTVDVPPESRLAAHRLQIEGIEVPVHLDPAVVERLVELPPPSLADLRSDQARLADHLAREHGLPVAAADLAVLRELSPLLRQHGWRARVAVRGSEIVAVHPPDRTGLGLAVDVGTTKVAAYLVDLESGPTLAGDGIMNPQIAWGEDVMSRIACAMRGQGKALQAALIDGLNGLIAGLCPEPDRIVEAVMVGNTAMHHLALGLPVRQLGLAPYVPAVSGALDVKARDLGLRIAPGASVHLLPNVAGFVGADHVAMVLASGIDDTERTVIGLDIGTNTEVVLAHRGRLTSCSTASGPAFEGAHIRHGMRALSGAIERVRLVDGQVEVGTVDGAPPVGLCGSGVLDAVGELCRAGLVDRRGRLRPGPAVRVADGGPEFLLVSGAASAHGRDITLSQQDIGQIQLAKGAILAGMELLLERAGLAAADLDEVVIGGAFGTRLRVSSAVAIGLLPPLPKERFRQVGNAAGAGARLALVSRVQRARAEEVARRIQYVELLTQPDFGSRFARQMYFPVC